MVRFHLLALRYLCYNNSNHILILGEENFFNHIDQKLLPNKYMNINNQKGFAKLGLIILVIVIIATIGFLLFVAKAILLPETLSANAELSPYNYIFQIILVGAPILFLLILYLAWKLNWTLKQPWTTLTLLSWSWPFSLLIFACPNQQSDMSGFCVPASIELLLDYQYSS